ncbi:MAG: hypothetical protein C5B46_09425 [Proteobacteria bacterium]|nr:MAG: hypothetical protein C5B46_09425 [Pseudomonadota bacterium]
MVETAVSVAAGGRGGLTRRVLVVWGVFIVLLAGIIVLELKDRADMQSEAAPMARNPRLLLPVPLAQVGAIEIVSGGGVHRFERDQNGEWFYHGVHATTDATHTHRADPALAQRIETAFEGFDRAQVERKLASGQSAEQFGLANPKMLILVYRPNEVQPLLQVAVGDVAPDTYSRYIMVVGGSSVVTIANYQIDNLLGLVKAAVESGQAKTSVNSG